MSAQPRTFETLSNTYTYVDVIGEGGCGTVLRVKSDDGQVWALKYLRPAQAGNERNKRFRNELGFCAKADHPNIVKVTDWNYVLHEGRKCPFYVMRLYPQTLRSLMQQGIAPDRVLGLFWQLLHGVAELHSRPIFHRDLKPENCLHDPESDSLVIADLGVAHFAEELLHTIIETRPGDRLANFQYAAPEQRSKGLPVDHRADIFALGMMLNEMFTGQAPQGEGYRKIADVASDMSYLDPVVGLMIRQSRDERPQSIGAVAVDILARQKEAASREKVSNLKALALPTAEVADPLVTDPVSVLDVDFPGGRITFKTNRPVNKTWLNCFRGVLPPRGNLNGFGPANFTFLEQTATAPIPSGYNIGTQHYQRVVDDFRDFVTIANRDYAALVRRRAEEARIAEVERRRQAIEQEEYRQRLRAQIRL